MFNLGIGGGFGAIGRIGPLKAGGGFFEDKVGLRNGSLVDHETDFHLWWSAFFWGDEWSFGGPVAKSRGKNFDTFYRSEVSYPWIEELAPFRSRNVPPSYLTQLEVSGALILGARIGFNPGELVDFFLGWFGLDIYDDDLGPQPPSESTGEDDEG